MSQLILGRSCWQLKSTLQCHRQCSRGNCGSNDRHRSGSNCRPSIHGDRQCSGSSSTI